MDYTFHSPWGDPESAVLEIRRLADDYLAGLDTDERQHEERVVTEVGRSARQRHVLTRDEFLDVCRWKSKRPSPRYEKNSEQDVIEITRAAFTSDNERLRIGVLMILDGVGWSVAAALLHTCHSDRYPMLDVRVARLLTGKVELYYNIKPMEWFSFWIALTRFSRELADEYHVEMRTLDRALFQLDLERNGTLPNR